MNLEIMGTKLDKSARLSSYNHMKAMHVRSVCSIME